VLAFSGSDDIAVSVFKLDTNVLVVTLRALVFLLPLIAFAITRRVCMELQRADWRAVVYGRDTGRVGELPGGGYVPVDQLNQAERYRLTARDNGPLNPLVHHGLKRSVMRRLASRAVRSILVRWVRRHRVRTLTPAQYELARRGKPIPDGEPGEPQPVCEFRPPVRLTSRWPDRLTAVLLVTTGRAQLGRSTEDERGKPGIGLCPRAGTAVGRAPDLRISG
jgi:hypothetical protein